MSTENGVSPFNIPEFNYEFVSPLVAHAAWVQIQQLAPDVLNRYCWSQCVLRKH